MNVKFTKFKKIIKWLLTICCLLYIVWFFSTNTNEFKKVLRLNPAFTILIAFSIFLSHMIYSLRFKMILEKCSNSSLPYWQWFKTVLLGRFLNAFAPQGGNIFRGTYLKSRFNISYTRYASSFFSFAWLDTCFNFLYATITILIVRSDIRIGNLNAFSFVLLCTIVTAVAPIFLAIVSRMFKLRNRYLSWTHSKLSEMLTVSVNNLYDIGFMLKFMLTGIIAFINTMATFYFCFLSLEIGISFPALVLFFVLLKLSSQVIITPGNLGLREIAYGILSKEMNLGMSNGLLISIIIRTIGMTIIITSGGLLGGYDLLRHRKEYNGTSQNNRHRF